jgi:hypothetical protein
LVVSLAPGFSPVLAGGIELTALAVSSAEKAAEAARTIGGGIVTGLKPGANERKHLINEV